MPDPAAATRQPAGARVSSMPVTVAVNAMGGDHGPAVTVPASLAFLEEAPGAAVVLVGRAEAI